MKTAKVYGMVANIDENIGRLLARLRQLDLERDTILIFMTDNGPTPDRYNAGMRGLKSSAYQGGIRVPCFDALAGAMGRRTGKLTGLPRISTCSPRCSRRAASPCRATFTLTAASCRWPRAGR